MRLHDLRKTSAFRLTLLFSLLLVGSVLLLFGFVYWQTLTLLSQRFDEQMASEAREIAHTPPEAQGLALDNLIASDPRQDWRGGLFDKDGHLLSGNIGTIPQIIVPDGKSIDIPRHTPGFGRHAGRNLRGLGLTLSDGRLLVIAHRADEVHEVRETLLNALTAGLIGSLALALLGGVVMSSAALRRVEAMRRAISAIMRGDLARRLPVAGSGDEFDRLADMVNAMLAEIERLIGDIKSAGDNIAHDLRTPLTRLRTRLEGALRRGGSGDEQRAAMEDAIADTDQILATFRALLRISEVEAGARRAGFTQVDLVKLAQSAAEFFEPLAVESGLAFTADIAPAAAVRGDPDLLFEAVANLLDNAVKFTPPGGRVTLTLDEAGEIAVADSGPGLPDGFRNALFQRFTRGDRARHLPGNGLGLSLVAAVAQLHGFALTFDESYPGCRAVITTGQGDGGADKVG
jgi:signal transduction histidine kinase